VAAGTGTPTDVEHSTRVAFEPGWAVTWSADARCDRATVGRRSSLIRQLSRGNIGRVSRLVSLASSLARHAGVAGLAVFAGACTQILDVGHDREADASVTCDAAGPGCKPIGLLDGLVGCWRLDDGAGSTVAFDSSGHGNHGAVHDLDPAAAWIAGRSGGALNIAHTGWVQVAPSPSIDSISDQITATAWVDLDGTITSADRWGTAMSRQTETSIDQHYHLSLDLDRRPSWFLMTPEGYALIKAANAAPMGTWTHLAGVYDGTTARLYVNGSEVASKALTGIFAPDTTPVILGGNINDAGAVPTELFPGRIDELTLYARALSATEIGQLAAGALSPAGGKDAAPD
jgi:hypothetical protein